MLKNMENHLWEEHREGSGPVVPHNSPTHERKGGSTGSARESPVANVKTLYGRTAGAVSRKMGVSQPAREKKAQAESNVNSANLQFVSSGSVFAIVSMEDNLISQLNTSDTHAHTHTHTHVFPTITGPIVRELQRGVC